MQFSLTSDLTAADKAKLVLHIDGSSDTFAFSAASGPSRTSTYEWESTGLDWSSESEVTLRLREVVASTDATLSGLAVNDGSTDLMLNPGFAPDEDTYTASVASTVAEVTVTPTTADDGATIEYLDASNMTLADVGTDAGQQVALALGDNVIKVQVTAEDTTTTRTYAVTVHRVSPTCTLNTGDLWCGVVTVGAIESSGSTFAYGFNSSVGNLSDTGFSVGTNPYTIDGTSVGAAGTTNAGGLQFSLTSALAAADKAKLVLHVGSAEFAFSDEVGLSSSQTYLWTFSGQDWSSVPNVTLRLRDSPISTDATLSGLAVNDGSTDVTLTPTFASGTTSYTASVANAVAELTVTPTTTDDGATIEYLNASNMTLADEGTEAGQQVALAVGANVIKVKVTAEDGTATRTYTVTATRAPTCTPNTAAGDIWCGVVTVGAIESSGSTFAYGFNSSVGHLSDTGFSVGTNPYTVDGTSVAAPGTSGAGGLSFSLTSALAAADKAKLVLHVGSAEFAFSDAVAVSNSNTYSWFLAGQDWSSAPNVTLRLRDGSTPDATDATLRGLVVNDGSTDLMLTPTFASDKYAYDASVANTVAEVTVTPTLNDTTATIEYLDASDMTLDDAGMEAGQQVTLVDGDNVINVKVTAADTTTTQTYAVTVNRAATAPGKPTGLTATASGSTQIDLSWTAPTDTGGSAITGYKIEVSTDGSTWTDRVADTGNDGTSYSHTGLAGGDTRHYRVSAINAEGTSAPSDAVSTNTDAPTAPGKPTGLTATASGSTQIDLTWTAPASDGGSAITGYKIEVSTDGTAWTDLVADTDSTDTSYSHTGLAAGDTRHYRVSAINAAGTSDSSDTVSTNTETTTTTPMSAPTNLGWGDGPGSLSTAEGVFLYFEFQAVPDSGTFYRYRLRRQGGGFGSWMRTGSVEEWSLGGNSLAAELVGHDWENHVTYTVELQASTSEGGGPAASITFTPKWLNLPQNVRVTPGDGRLTVAWDPPVENSCAVLSYHVGYSDPGGGGSGRLVTGTEETITGLTNGAEYGISVVANAGYDPPCLDADYAGDGPVDSGPGPTVYGTPGISTDPPTVESVAVKSAPQSGDTYGWGETIVFTLTFSEKVRVTGQPQPKLAFVLGGSTREARYEGMTDTDVDSDPRPRPEGVKVHFYYTVQPGDWDSDGIQVGELASAIDLGGARIQSAADLVDADGHKVDGVDANLAHAALGQLRDHKVDARTARPPAGSGVTIIDTDGAPLAGNPIRLTIRESTRGRYGLKLNTQPTHTVRVVAIHSDGDQDLEVLPTAQSEKAITPAEWETPFYMEIRAALDDDEENGERVFLNRVHSQDPAYNDLILPDVIVVEDDSHDDAGALSVADANATEGVDATLDFVVKLNRKPWRDLKVTVDYRTQEGTATAGSDYTSMSGMLTFAPGEDKKTVSVPIMNDDVEDSGETFTLVLSNPSGAGFASFGQGAVGTIRNTETPALTASFEGVPEAHDGETAFRVRVAFSEGISISYTRMRDASFTVTAGEVTAARRVDGRRDLWEITIAPDSDEAVTVRLPETTDCGASAAICTGDGRGLSHALSATVAGPAGEPESNTAATGTPAIGGTAQVGEALTASTSGISDADGLDDARFAYQWIRTDTDIGGATGSTYTPVAADEGERLKVRVDFTDDAGHAERLTSAATDAVAARPEPLTASFEGLPAEHAGQGSFSFRVAFSEGINISYKTVRDASFTVTGGEVTQASRVDRRRDLWKITIAPDADGAVTVRLPETTDCGASGAICTGDGRGLSHALSATVAGPVGVTVADARVEEGANAVLAFAVTLSRAASAALTVDYATADGSAHAGDDYTAASGTLTFAAGERATTIEVGVLDDAHDEGEETLTLRLSNPSGGRLADGEATGTIENHDPMPKALLARFGRTAAVHVVEHVEERLAAPREPGFRGRFAGRELRRGMERDIALNVLRQLGGAAGAGPMGAGAGGPLAGAPASAAPPFGMPGPAGGGGHLAAAGPMGGAAGPDGRFDGGGLLRMGLGGGDVLTGSDFALARETRHGGILSFWSRGAQSRFSGREGALSLGGDVRTTMFGADYAKGPLVTGLSLSNSRGLGEYTGIAGGQVASSVTGLYPWLGYKATDRVTVWGVAGYGAGGLRLTPEGGPALESGLSMAMAAAGTRGELISGGAGGFALAFKADALWVGTSIDGVDGAAGRLAATSAAVTRFRTGLEGSRAYTLAGRLSLKPSVEVGLRHDGGDAETGAGLDVGGGLVVSDASTGLAVDLRVRMLVMHQAEGFRERGMAISLSYNPRPSTPLGFTAKVAPSWGGQATSGAEALWGRETMAGMAPGGVADGTRLDAELGYGLPVGSRFVGTPTVGVGTSAYGRDYRLGYRLGALGGAGTTVEFGVDAQRRESPLVGGTDHGARAQASVGW